VAQSGRWGQRQPGGIFSALVASERAKTWAAANGLWPDSGICCPLLSTIEITLIFLAAPGLSPAAEARYTSTRGERKVNIFLYSWHLAVLPIAPLQMENQP
jgi:hypothetical protein